MAKKNIVEANQRILNNNNNNKQQRTVKNSSTKYFKTIVSPPPSPLRSDSERLASPVGVVSTPPNTSKSQGNSPRTSPGLLAGHYAGCKFTEPPLPSALPLPPQHWMQQNQNNVLRAFIEKQKPGEMTDIAHQLKVLLKVQA